MAFSEVYSRFHCESYLHLGDISPFQIPHVSPLFFLFGGWVNSPLQASHHTMFDFGDLSDAESVDDGAGESPEEMQQKRKADAAVKFLPGDVVKARFQQGCWYLATVLCENSNGVYTISWKDGDDHDRIKSGGELIYIRPGDSKSASWSAKTSKPPRAASSASPVDSKPPKRMETPNQAVPETFPRASAETSREKQEDKSHLPEDMEQKKWNEWDAQQRRFRQELEDREEREDQKWLDARMARLHQELKEIDLLAPGVKKSRLRKLQLELHPDKQPERMRAKAQQLFLIVQGKWEANEATFQRDAQVKTQNDAAQATQAAAQAAQAAAQAAQAAAKAAAQAEERRRQEERAKAKEREREREREEERARERERKESERAQEEEKRRKKAESRAKQAEDELKRFKEAAARQRTKQAKCEPGEKQPGFNHNTFGKAPNSSDPSATDQADFAGQTDSPILSAGQKENAPPNKDVGSIHVRVRVNGLNSSRPIFSVKSTATVGAIRESLEALTKIPISLQKLHLGERELFDFETLRQLVKSGNMLDLDITEVPQKGTALADRIRRNWRMLQHASEQMRSDKTLVLEAVKQSWEALQFAAEHLQRDREIVLCAVEQDGLALEHASSEVYSDREIMLKAVQRTWRALRYAPSCIAADSEIAFLAVHQDWRALQYVSVELRDHQELLEVAIQQSGLALRYASKRLQKDHATVLAAVRQNGNAFAHAAVELRADRQFVLAAVWKNGAALRYCDPDLRADQEVALAAVSGWD